jgi:hypothetical protein
MPKNERKMRIDIGSFDKGIAVKSAVSREVKGRQKKCCVEKPYAIICL